MYCLIKKVYNIHHNNQPNYFNVTYAKNNSIEDYIEFPKMLRENNSIPLERSAQGQPLNWYAVDFPLKFAVTDLFKSNKGKTIREFFEPDNSRKFVYWAWLGNSSRQDIRFGGEIDMKTLTVKPYAGECSISCQVVSFEKQLEWYLKNMRAKRYPGSGYYRIDSLFDAYEENNPVLRFAHPDWSSELGGTVPFISNPLFNAWAGQLLGTELGTKTAWDVFYSYISQNGIAWRCQLSPSEAVNGFTTIYIKMFFPSQNNEAITIDKYREPVEGISVTEKDNFMLVYTRYELDTDPAQYINARYGYLFINQKQQLYSYNSLVPAIPPDPVVVERSYQPEAYFFENAANPSLRFGLLKEQLLELNDGLAYFTTVNGYKMYISFGRCILPDEWEYINGIYYDYGHNLIAGIAAKNLAYLANGKKKTIEFETTYQDNVNYAISVNNFKGKNWWIYNGDLNKNENKMNLKLVEK